MGLVHENLFPKIVMEERATDGSDTSNPSADHRALFLGEDGLLHLRDSSGTITDVGGTGSGNVATDAIWDAKGDLAVGTGANTAQRLAKGTDTHVLTADSGETTGLKWAAPSGGPTKVYKSADQTSTSDALADVTDLTFSVSANKDYYFEFHVLTQATNTAYGLMLSVNGPASPTDIAFDVIIPQTTSSRVQYSGRAYDGTTQSASIDTANDSTYNSVRGILRNGANAGSLTLRFRCEGAGQEVSIRQGSCGFLTLLN